MNEAWNDIIHTAMIGTDKKSVVKNNLPPELVAIAEKIESTASGKEEAFLNLSGLILNCRQTGTQPLNIPVQAIAVCAEEDLPYCNEKATGVLQSVLSEDNEHLLAFWLQRCAEKKQIVTPVFLPQLLNLALRNKSLRENVMACVGQRGKWLVQFNPGWQFGRDETPAEIFVNGKSEERKKALSMLRQQDPATAFRLLQECWKSENANTRAELMAVLKENLSLAEEPWLVEQTKDKSQKVKEKAIELLKSLKGSQVVEEIWNFTKPLISLKKSSALLGLVSKENIVFDLNFEIPKHFKDYGVQDLEANKIYSEKEFTLSQLIGMIPPDYWEKHLSMQAGEILELLSKRDETKKYISSFAASANLFKNTGWAVPLYMKYNAWCMDLMSLYDFETREAMVLRAMADDNSSHTLRNIEVFRPVKDEEWSLGFSIEFLKRTAADPYAFNKNYYKPLLLNLPVNLIEHLPGIVNQDDGKKAYWENLREELGRLLTIKKQIITSF